MSKRFIISCWSIAALVFSLNAPQVVQAAESDAMLVQPAIDNFDIVSSDIWRGSAPSDEAIKKLAGHGVKTIVDLRMDLEGCDHEKSCVDKCGMKYVHIPFGFRKPSIEQVGLFLRVVSAPENQPVYVHCRQGADRTGMLVGIYRILVQHWSYEKVYSEMRLHHFKPWLAGMKKTVELVSTNPLAQQFLLSLMKNDRSERPTATTAMNTLSN